MEKKDRATKAFQDTIRKYLEERAKTDTRLSERLHMEGKTIEECCDYIVSEVQKLASDSQMIGLSDDEVYGLAVHYYDEDDLKAPKNTNFSVIINHDIELTEQEKAELKQEAKEKFLQQEIQLQRIENNKIKTKAKPTPETQEKYTQLSLF